jgi:hypothetical protein
MVMSSSLFKLAMEGEGIRGQEVKVLQTDGIGATGLPRLDSLPDSMNTFIGTANMQLLFFMFGEVNMNVSSGLLRSDHFRHGTGLETGLSRKAVWYRAFFARIESFCLVRLQRGKNV